MNNNTLLDNLAGPGALHPLFQPIVELGPGGCELHALEALMRGPAGTNIESADVLFEYVRLKGAEAPVDRLCISTVLEQVGQWPEIARQAINIHFNVHASTLRDDGDFIAHLRQQAESHRVPLARLTLEIIEHAPFWDGSGFRRAFDELRQVGVRIAVDDVGRGESNFRMILACQPDYLKVDRSLVDGIARDRYKYAVVESLLGLAKKLGSWVVAEGIERQEDLEILRSLGTELFQGYLFDRPLLPAEICERYFQHPEPMTEGKVRLVAGGSR